MAVASPMPLFGGSPQSDQLPALPSKATHAWFHPLPETPPCPSGGCWASRDFQELALPLARSSLRFQLCPSGNGDILSYEDANRAMQTGVAGIMIAR